MLRKKIYNLVLQYLLPMCLVLIVYELKVKCRASVILLRHMYHDNKDLFPVNNIFHSGLLRKKKHERQYGKN